MATSTMNSDVIRLSAAGKSLCALRRSSVWRGSFSAILIVVELRKILSGRSPFSRLLFDGQGMGCDGVAAVAAR